MQIFTDRQDRSIRLTDERREHIETAHPEIRAQIQRIGVTLKHPDRIVRSRTDRAVELFYKHYESTPVTTKHLCVVVKSLENDQFIITAYFTDSIKKGEVLWSKK